MTKAKLSSDIDLLVKKQTPDIWCLGDYTSAPFGVGNMDVLVDGEGNGSLCILAHGAGAPMDSSFMSEYAQGLAEKGVRVIRFEFPYMQERRLNGKKRPPNRQPELIECFKQVLKDVDGPCVLAGKSMGGRMASILASIEDASANIKGVLALGYPFHPQGKPEKLRTEHFPDLKAPMLIMQGSRDALGSIELVEALPIPSNIKVHWLEDGNHDLKPRVKSGFTHEQHKQVAIECGAQFIKDCLA